MLYESGYNYFINPYFDIFTQYKPLEKGENVEVNDIGGVVKTKGINTVALNLEDDTGKLHSLIFEQIY